jgi:thiamine biosynthesis protein ThiI|tara:strand:+ start:265 stop:1425 length:1161 start_codon:yes stop_codon:yes gene_type:complete
MNRKFLLDVIIVRYGEIGIKSKNTRLVFERKLIERIKDAIGNKKVTREYGRIYVHSASIKDAEVIARVFGVVSTSVAFKISSDFNEILKKGVDYASNKIGENVSFAVRARRVGKHDYTSIELARELGAKIIEATGAKVNLTKPDISIHVEIRYHEAYLFDTVIKGVGGMPLGSQGTALAMISGGIDSPVAAWMMMKRGTDIIAMFMNPSPLVDDRTLNRTMASIKKLASWKNGEIKTYIVPYGNILIELLKAKNDSLGCILCKRAMYRTAQIIARKEKIGGLITGESLGQVASQTLHNLAVIDEVSEMPIYRPLIGYDKEDIIRLAKKIGTYEISIMPANCCLGPPLYPATKASLKKVRDAEKEVDALKIVLKMCKDVKVLKVGKV